MWINLYSGGETKSDITGIRNMTLERKRNMPNFCPK